MTGRGRLAAALTVALLCTAFIGRSVISADGAEMVSEALGLLVTGSLSVPIPLPSDLTREPAPAFHSHYGFFPSAFLVPFVAWAWPLRGLLGPSGYDAAVALVWAAGALACALAFFRLAREILPAASPLWVPAFLAGTFLWPYAADSFLEPFAGAGLALSAAGLLSPRVGAPSGARAGALFAFAALLKPVLWALSPIFLLATALVARDRREGAGVPLAFGAAAGAGLAAAVVGNGLRYGFGSNFGYGGEALQFTSPLLAGVAGLLLSPGRGLLSPGRGLLLLAPVSLAALLALRRVQAPVAVLCGAAPALHVLLIARWYGWHGGSAWGPRHLLPILPLLVAPAVLGSRRVLLPLLGLGACLNLAGVLVAAGAWVSYVERLVPPPGAGWPTAGSDRLSSDWRLAPAYGHAWLLARSAGLRLPAPWLRAGATEQAAPPSASGYLSPWLLRRAASLPPLRPMVPSLLYRAGVAALQRGRPALASPFLRETLRTDPGHRPAADLLGQVERARVPSGPEGRSPREGEPGPR